MNWDAAGAIGEIVGAVAVVISILYLSVQVRSNTRAMRATSGYDATHSWAAANETLLSYAPEIRAACVRAAAPASNWSDFTREEKFNITIYFRSCFQKLEGQYFLLKYGYLDEGLWSKRLSWAASLIQLPVFAVWWQREKVLLIYSDEFVALVEAAVRASPVTPSLDSDV